MTDSFILFCPPTLNMIHSVLFPVAHLDSQRLCRVADRQLISPRSPVEGNDKVRKNGKSSYSLLLLLDEIFFSRTPQGELLCPKLFQDSTSSSDYPCRMSVLCVHPATKFCSEFYRLCTKSCNKFYKMLERPALMWETQQTSESKSYEHLSFLNFMLSALVHVF